MADPAYIDSAGVLTKPEGWVALTRNVLSVDTATVIFTSTDDGQVGDWSQYMSLFVVITGSNDNSSTYSSASTYMRLNGDTGSFFATSQFYSNGSGDAVGTYTVATTAWNMGDLPAQSAVNPVGIVLVRLNDINSGKFQCAQFRNGSNAGATNAGYVRQNVGTYIKQAPTTSILVWGAAGDWFAGSAFDLYGELPSMLTASGS